MRNKPHNRPASVAVEMALCAPVVCFALVALADLCLASATASNVQTATASANTLCSQGIQNCHRHKIRHVCGIPHAWKIDVTTQETSATDAYGQPIYTATITITAPYEWMTPGADFFNTGDTKGPPNTITRTTTTPILNSPPTPKQ